MNKENRKQKVNKRKRSWLSNWRKSIASAILALACIVSLAAAMAPTAAKSDAIPMEYAQNQTDTGTNSTKSSESKPEKSEEPKTPEKPILQVKPEKQIEFDATIINNDDTSKQGSAQEPTANNPDTIKEQVEQAENQIPSNPSEDESQKVDEIEDDNSSKANEAKDDNSSNTDATEDYDSSNKELEEILYDLYVEEGHDPKWDLSASRNGDTIWVEQYEPLTEELIIGLGNLIFEEVGGYIGTQPYKKAMKAYMLIGSTVLHRREVEYGGDKSIYDVVHRGGQYSTSWAFDLKQRVEGSVDEAYVVAEILLRNGPIGPRNLVYGSPKSKHTPYWNTGEDPHFRTTYFDTTSKFADYEEIQTEVEETKTEVEESQTEVEETKTEMEESQTEVEGVQTEVAE